MNPQLELITEQLRQGHEVTSNQLLSLAMTESRPDVRQLLEALSDARKPSEASQSKIGKLMEKIKDLSNEIDSASGDLESAICELEEEISE